MGDWLEQLYKELVSLATNNKDWCSQVFPEENADVIISAVFTGRYYMLFGPKRPLRIVFVLQFVQYTTLTTPRALVKEYLYNLSFLALNYLLYTYVLALALVIKGINHHQRF